MSKSRYLVVVALLLSSLLVCWVGGAKEAKAAADPVLVAAGDIASCNSSGDEATAKLLDNTRGTVVTLGDHVYPNGTAAEFRDCYGPSWGRHKARTKPSVGNHEYNTPGASGYFGYFGSAAGPSGKGYYSYDKGRWHIVVLNSNCYQVGGCTADSPQGQWLRNDLAANAKRCTLAYWHHPRFHSTLAGINNLVEPFWKALYKARAEVVLNGHAHNYERFAPQRPDGTLAREKGIREFVVGTGGRNLEPFKVIKPNSKVRNANTFGVLRLSLHRNSYDWRFKPVAGETFTDSGTSRCH
jgi:acid phosphatase type 7